MAPYTPSACSKNSGRNARACVALPQNSISELTTFCANWPIPTCTTFPCGCRFGLSCGTATTSTFGGSRERPTHLKATLQVAGQLETRLFPAKEQPYAVALPVWAPPGIITGHALTTDFPREGKYFYYYVPPNLQAEIPKGQFLVDARSNTTTFARAMMTPARSTSPLWAAPSRCPGAQVGGTRGQSVVPPRLIRFMNCEIC